MPGQSTSETRVVAALHLARIALEAAVDTVTQELADRLAARRLDEIRTAAHIVRLLEVHVIEDMPGGRHLLPVCNEHMEAFSAQRFGTAPLALQSWTGLIVVTKPMMLGDSRVIAIVPSIPEGRL